MNEEWRDIEGYKGCYQVSSAGKVRSIRYGLKVLKQRIKKTGYVDVNFSVNGVRKVFLVHRLVAETFLGKPKNKEVNHIDGNKLNNRLENLNWVTHSENIKHAYDSGLFKRKNTNP